ncbi:MAG: glucose-6-phosphate dehydrogenase assembly protein OpcA, partial [Myxococcota bacterium]|nr:glucose-6-phosphate dehydrogenase assembly protein OpcA [Myxococcota bacterium]
VLDQVAEAHPSRTIAAVWKSGAVPSITADVALRRLAERGPTCGDAIVLEACGVAREWLPENVQRFILADLPVCVWWVGDLPDFDHLFERMVVGADLVVVNSAEMDLRDLQELSALASRPTGSYAIADLAWIRLRSLQDLVARFFDDEAGARCLGSVARITIAFSPPAHEDVASTTAGLLVGWMAHALALPLDSVTWSSGDGWAEAKLADVSVRFEPRPRADVPAGSILDVVIESSGARFEVERQADPQVFRWLREVAGGAMPAQTLRLGMHEEGTLLVRALVTPKRDPLLEVSLRAASRIVQAVAPRRSSPPT